MKEQPLRDLIEEMRAIARGEVPPPPGAALPSIESPKALLRLLAADNRLLLRTIRDTKLQ
jgi:hypothetical protein